MKRNYDVLSDNTEAFETEAISYEGKPIDYREYKKIVRNLQISFEQIFSELKENIDAFENGIQEKNENDVYLFTVNNKQTIENLEQIYKKGLTTLNLMKSSFVDINNYTNNNNNNNFSNNSTVHNHGNNYNTYSIEITRYWGIFENFKIQLQNVKSNFDKTYLSSIVGNKGRNYETNFNNNNTHDISVSTQQNDIKGGNNIMNKPSNDINYVFKERNALEFSLNELDNIITEGEQTTAKLKKQNYNIMQQLKKIDIINQYVPQIQKILKNIKYHNLKKTLILGMVIALCIFFFFLFT